VLLPSVVAQCCCPVLLPGVGFGIDLSERLEIIPLAP